MDGRVLGLNSIFEIENIEFIINLKKKTKLLRLANWKARMVLIVVWKSLMIGVMNDG